MVSYKGKLSVAVIFPIFAQLLASFDLGGLAAEVAAVLQLSVSFVPPTFTLIGSVMAALTAAISAMVTAGIQPPSVNISADLLLKYSLLKARLELLLTIKGLLTGGSLRVYEHAGLSSTFGAELGATLSGDESSGGMQPSQSTFAVVLLAEAGSSGEATLKALRGGV